MQINLFSSAIPFGTEVFSKFGSIITCVLLLKVALVTWTESVGLALVRRDLSTMALRTPTGNEEIYTILQIFPFTSETKRMGIIVKV